MNSQLAAVALARRAGWSLEGTPRDSSRTHERSAPWSLLTGHYRGPFPWGAAPEDENGVTKDVGGVSHLPFAPLVIRYGATKLRVPALNDHRCDMKVAIFGLWLCRHRHRCLSRCQRS